MGDGATTSQFPSGSGSSMPSHINRVDPFRPECPSCSPMRAVVRSWTKSTMRRHPVSCSGAYIPAQPGVMRPCRRDADHLGHHQCRAAERLAAGLHEMKVVGHAVVRGVHVHRRDDRRDSSTRGRAAGTAGTSAVCVVSGVPRVLHLELAREPRVDLGARIPGRAGAGCRR